MAGDLKRKEGAAVVNLQTAAGSTLANNTAALAATAVLDLSTGLYDFVNFVLATGFSVAPAVGAEIALYAVPKFDGTNFADIGTNAFNPDHYVNSFVVTKSQTGSQILTVQRAILEPWIYRCYLLNLSGQTMATGYTLDAYGSLSQYT